jgi:hypothetical protein
MAARTPHGCVVTSSRHALIARMVLSPVLSRRSFLRCVRAPWTYRTVLLWVTSRPVLRARPQSMLVGTFRKRLFARRSPSPTRGDRSDRVGRAPLTAAAVDLLPGLIIIA